MSEPAEEYVRPPAKAASSADRARLRIKGPEWDEPGPGTGKLTRREHAQLSGHTKARAQGEKRRGEFLEALKAGKTVAAALDTLGIPKGTYDKWKQRWPEFRQEVDRIRTNRDDFGLHWQGDFTSFRKRYFGFDTYFHQREIVRAIETSPPQGITMVLCPPEHGKTTVLEDYICYRIATDPNVRIMVVSENQKHSRKILNRIKLRLTTPSDFLARFGPFYQAGQERSGKPWTADFFTVCRASHDERDYTLNTVGVTGQVAGTRADLLIIDDVQSKKNYAQTEEIVEVLRQDFFTRPGTDGRTIITGTRVGVHDVYEVLEDAYDDLSGSRVLTEVVKLPATDDDGNPLCPELWPKAALERKKVVVGPDVWWRNYQQRPRSGNLATFSAAMVDDCKNPLLRYGVPIKGGMTILSLDPALGGGNATTALSFDATRLRIVDQVVDRGLARVEDIIARVAEFAAKYDPRYCVIETMDFQKGLEQDERLREVAETYGFVVTGHLTGGGGVRKRDEVIGVAQMPKSFIDHTFEIPWADDDTKARMNPLIEELLAWSPNVPTKKLVQDRVMSLWFGWIFARERMRYFAASQNHDWKMRALPWAPTKVALSHIPH